MKIGDRIDTWFNPKAKIISIFPYTGCYEKVFSKVIRVTAPRTNRGWMEILVNL